MARRTRSADMVCCNECSFVERFDGPVAVLRLCRTGR